MNEKGNGSPEPDFLDELEVMEEADNYNRWIFDSIRPYLGSEILEIGCGIGTFTEKILSVGTHLTSIDIDERCVTRVRSRLSSDRLQACVLPAERVGELHRTFDTVVMINILEHVKDDAGLLGDLRGVLDGKLVILVPAFSFLYGKTDELVGHCRRYSRKELLSVVKSSGYRVLRCSYFNLPGFFAWFLMNRIVRQETNTVGKVKLYDKTVVPVFSRLESFLRPPFGQSLILVAST